jgi:hypothetical protein
MYQIITKHAMRLPQAFDAAASHFFLFHFA